MSPFYLQCPAKMNGTCHQKWGLWAGSSGRLSPWRIAWISVWHGQTAWLWMPGRNFPSSASYIPTRASQTTRTTPIRSSPNTYWGHAVIKVHRLHLGRLHIGSLRANGSLCRKIVKWKTGFKQGGYLSWITKSISRHIGWNLDPDLFVFFISVWAESWSQPRLTYEWIFHV